MADYVYRISASGTATGADAGFTTLNAAVSDFTSNDRMGGGANGRVAANSTLYFRIDGFLSLAGGDVTGMDTTTNSNAAVVVDAWADPWNSAVRGIGAGIASGLSAYDGIDFGNSASMNAGINSTRQAKLTVQNLVLTSSLNGYGPVEAYGPTDGSSNVTLKNLIIRNTHATAGKGVKIDAGNMVNCAVILPNSSTSVLIDSIGRTGGNKIDQCVVVCLGTALRLITNQNDPLPIFRNSYVAGFTNWTDSSTWTSATTGNATDKASGWPGSPASTTYSVAVSTTNFENVTAGSEDLRVKVTSVLKTTGATELGTVGTDVFGQDRSATTTIGAFAAEVSTQSQSPRSTALFNQMRAQ
jgi:hypothetical protein